MRKRLFLCCFFAVAIMKSVTAYDFSSICPSGDLLFYNILDSSTATVEVTFEQERWGANYVTAEPDSLLIIPSTVVHSGVSYTVVRIGNSAFSQCYNLTYIVIPNTVTTIGEWAFSECSGIQTISFGNAVTSIETYAFDLCTSLTTLSLPLSLTSIGTWAFWGCSSLTSLIIPGSVTSIGNHAFQECSGLTSLSLPNSISYISDGCFSQCSSLSTITIPNSVGAIGPSAFSRCTGLTTIIIPSSVRSISQSAFFHCTGLQSITLPDSLTHLYMEVFYECTNLHNITIPASLTFFASNVFRACYGLQNIYYSGSLEQWCNITFYNEIANPLYYGENLFIDGELVTDIHLSDTLSSISNYSFVGCSSIKTVDLGDGVVSVGEKAFAECDSIKKITLGSSLTSIGSRAFYACYGIDTIFSRALSPSYYNWSEGYYDWEYDIYRQIQSNIPVFIPCGTVTLYQNTWPYFTNYQNGDINFVVVATASNNLYGTVSISDINCDSTVTLSATPEYGYTFTGWSDGINDNPRIIHLIHDTTIIAYFSEDEWDSTSTYSDIWRVWSKCMNATPSTFFDIDLSYDSSTSVINIGPIVHYPEIYRLTLTGSYTIATNTLVIDIRNDVDEGYGWVHCRTDRHTTQLIGNNINDVVGVLTYDGMAGCTTAIDLERLLSDDVPSISCNEPTSIMATALSTSEIEVQIEGNPGVSFCIYYTDGTTLDSIIVDTSVYVITGLSAETMYSISALSICGNGTRSAPTGTTASTMTCGDSSCVITITMSDSYGDGWNGNSINGFSRNAIVFSASCDGYSSTFTHYVCGNDSIILKWHQGGWPEETTFSIFVGDEQLLSGYGQDYSEGQTILVINGCLQNQSDTNTYCDTLTIVNVIHDTITLYIEEYIQIHDTTTVTEYVFDTTYLWQYDTTYVDNYIHDTTYINNYIHDTTVVDNYIYDTTFINNYIHDTTTVMEYVYDTTYLWQYDTTYVDNYIHDTTIVTEYFYDTTVVTEYFYDTTIVVDTLWLTDTIYLHDTIYIHDTIYVTDQGIGDVETTSVKIFQRNGQVVVEGFGNEDVCLFDMLGRSLAVRRMCEGIQVGADNRNSVIFDVPVSGAYLIKVGDRTTRKIVVIK